jgi:hypothetical protein
MQEERHERIASLTRGYKRQRDGRLAKEEEDKSGAPKHGGIKEILETRQCPGIVGAKGSFQNFYHKGKEITTWKEWEKAGYSNPLESNHMSHDMKEMVKEKIEKTKKTGEDNLSPKDKKMINDIYSKD